MRFLAPFFTCTVSEQVQCVLAQRHAGSFAIFAAIRRASAAWAVAVARLFCNFAGTLNQLPHSRFAILWCAYQRFNVIVSEPPTRNQSDHGCLPIYFEDEPGGQSAANLLTKDEAAAWPPAAATLPLGGSRDVLALDGADRLHRDHQPNQNGARRQVAIPRLAGSHCRQSDLRRIVGVALLVSRYPSRISPQTHAPQLTFPRFNHI
jgi:hypothetical protein